MTMNRRILSSRLSNYTHLVSDGYATTLQQRTYELPPQPQKPNQPSYMKFSNHHGKRRY